MSKQLTAKNVHIGSRAPVRKDVATLPNYFSDHSAAFDAIDTILAKHNLMIDPNVMLNLNSQNDRAYGEGSAGTLVLKIRTLDDKIACDCCGVKIKDAVYSNGISYSWYRMQSGKLEITAYVSL